MPGPYSAINKYENKNNIERTALSATELAP